MNQEDIGCVKIILIYLHPKVIINDSGPVEPILTPLAYAICPRGSLAMSKVFSFKGRNTRLRPIVWIFGWILFFAICLCAICVSLLVAMHNAAKDRAVDVASHLVAAIKNDVRRNIESIDLSLQAVIDGLQRPDIDQLDPGLRQAVLFDRSASARHLGLIIVTDKLGNIRFDSRTINPEPVNSANRDYFEVHKNKADVGLYIGGPSVGRLTGRPFIGISRALAKPDGSFAGVAAASLQLQYFQDLFASVSLGPESNVTLASTDGTVIMRWPYDSKYIGLNIKSAELYKYLAHSSAGHFETNAAIDGIHRLVVYSKIGDLPLVIGVGQSTNEIFSQWRRYALVLSILVAVLFTSIGVLLFYLAREFNKRSRYEASLTETKQFLDSIIANIPNAIVVKDVKSRKFVLTNSAYEKLVGFSKAQLVGKSAFDIYRAEDAQLMDKSDRECLLYIGGVTFNDYEVEIPSHGSRIISTKRIVIRDAQGHPKYLLVVIEDVTDRRKSEHQIAFMAHHDALTGLTNRAAVTQKIEEAASRQRRFGHPFTILLMDLDRFKHVNDTLGHPTGDALLREVARRLKEVLRETDVLARLGGDEFAIIQSGETNQRDAAAALAARILDIFAKPFDVDGNELNIGTSIGIALAPEHGTSSDSVLKKADLALYRAKSAGRSGYCFFDDGMGAAANARHQLENELRRAIQNEEFELYYQPIIDTKTRKICSAEALARWRHPSKGIILPEQFIPIAEETGMIAQIGEWALQTACLAAVAWPAHIKVAVNLSPVHFRRSNLPDVVLYALAQSGLPPERLELEITESALIESGSDCLPTLRQFKNLGISIALDDFGTGYSSLSQLTMFPFDKIKIDKSFTQNLTKRTDCAAIISATLTLAQSLGITTTAEGVETAEQYRLLRLAGVTSMQGHLFKAASPLSEINLYAAYDIRDAAERVKDQFVA